MARQNNVVQLPQRDYKKDTGYRWIDKDPLIDFMVSIIKDSGYSYAAIERMTGVSSVTLKRWETGETRKPRRETMDIILRVLGYEFGVYKTTSRRRVL